jgi:hypothetical protein
MFLVVQEEHSIFLDNGRIVLIPVLALKEDRVVMALTSMRVTTKYNHRPKSIIIRSAQAHTDKQKHQKCTRAHR